MTINLFNYNNYYNRIIKRYNTIDDYYENASRLLTQSSVNFNPNDGVMTQLVINYDNTIMPDYLVCTNEYNEIVSRWFVTEAVRNLVGQYNITLLRDLIADYYNEVVNAPCFIEKAILGVNDDLIFNSENMSYNQIKTSETLLDGNSPTSWYAAYINKDVGDIELNVPAVEYPADITVTNLEEYYYYKYTTERYLGDYTSGPLFSIQASNLHISGVFRFTVSGANNNPKTPTDGETYWWSAEGITGVRGSLGEDNNFAFNIPDGKNFETVTTRVMNEWEKIIKKLNANKELNLQSYDYIEANKGQPLVNDSQKIIYESSTGKYYKVIVNNAGNYRNITRINNTSALGLKIVNEIKANEYLSSYTINGEPIDIEYSGPIYKISFEEMNVETINLTIPASRRHCEDMPYDILMFPKNNISVDYETTTGTYITNAFGYISERLINQLMLKLDSEKQLYDVQLIPYCSIPEVNMAKYDFISGEDIKGRIRMIGKYTPYVDYVKDNKSFCFMPRFASFSKTLTNSIYKVETPDNSIDFKIENETGKYRLCSPNYNGQFEFSATANRGIKGYNVTCTLKPYSPYIKVAPIFDGLYGQDFGDARGLICGGDFSITQISSSWATYELNNKNYQAMFDRQIQNMEINNSIQRDYEAWSIATGTISGITQGALAGSNIGGGVGAIIGGVVGGAASLGGGILDRKYNELMRTEALDYTKDLFGYQLGNIKALPYNITKVTANNFDNKIFPFVEYFTCTEVEKEALRNKIKYNGMTVMTIGAISSYLQSENTYIKGKLIRLENIADDSHIVNAIANEINKGVYIKYEYSE